MNNNELSFTLLKHPDDNGLYYDSVKHVYLKFNDVKQQHYFSYTYSLVLYDNKYIKLKNKKIKLSNYDISEINKITCYIVYSFEIIDSSDNKDDIFTRTLFFAIDTVNIGDKFYFVKDNHICSKTIVNIIDDYIYYCENEDYNGIITDIEILNTYKHFKLKSKYTYNFFIDPKFCLKYYKLQLKDQYDNTIKLLNTNYKLDYNTSNINI